MTPELAHSLAELVDTLNMFLLTAYWIGIGYVIVMISKESHEKNKYKNALSSNSGEDFEKDVH